MTVGLGLGLVIGVLGYLCRRWPLFAWFLLGIFYGLFGGGRRRW